MMCSSNGGSRSRTSGKTSSLGRTTGPVRFSKFGAPRGNLDVSVISSWGAGRSSRGKKQVALPVIRSCSMRLLIRAPKKGVSPNMNGMSPEKCFSAGSGAFSSNCLSRLWSKPRISGGIRLPLPISGAWLRSGVGLRTASRS